MTIYLTGAEEVTLTEHASKTAAFGPLTAEGPR